MELQPLSGYSNTNSFSHLSKSLPYTVCALSKIFVLTGPPCRLFPCVVRIGPSGCLTVPLYPLKSPSDTSGQRQIHCHTSRRCSRNPRCTALRLPHGPGKCRGCYHSASRCSRRERCRRFRRGSVATASPGPDRSQCGGCTFSSAPSRTVPMGGYWNNKYCCSRSSGSLRGDLDHR